MNMTEDITVEGIAVNASLVPPEAVTQSIEACREAYLTSLVWIAGYKARLANSKLEEVAKLDAQLASNEKALGELEAKTAWFEAFRNASIKAAWSDTVLPALTTPELPNVYGVVNKLAEAQAEYLSAIGFVYSYPTMVERNDATVEAEAENLENLALAFERNKADIEILTAEITFLKGLIPEGVVIRYQAADAKQP